MPFYRGRTVCLPPSRRDYTLLIRPDRLSRARVAYPTTATAALAQQSIRFRVAPKGTVTLTASYLDVAPISTVLVPASSVIVPRGRTLPSVGRFTLRRNLFTRRLRAGDILVVNVGRGLPHGVLAVVGSVRRRHGALLVRTAAVSPFEAFTRGVMKVSVGAPRARSSRVRRGRSADARVPARIAEDEQAPFTVGCGPTGALNATIAPRIEPHASIEIGWEDPDLFNPIIHGRFSLEPGISLESTLKTLIGIRCSVSHALAEVTIGSVETDFCPTITFKLAAIASVSAALGEPIDQKLTARLEGGIGASFKFGATTPELKPESTLSPQATLEGAGGQTPESWEGTVSAGIGPALIVECGVQGVAGVGPELGIEDVGTLSGTPSGWAVRGGVEASVGVVLNVLGYSFSDSVNVPIGEEIPIISGGWGPAPSPVLSPVVSYALPYALSVEWQKPAYGGSEGLNGYALETIREGSCPAEPPERGVQTVQPTSTSALVTESEGRLLEAGRAYTVCIYARSNRGQLSRVASTGASTEAPTLPGAPAVESVSGGVGSCSAGEAEGPVAHITFRAPSDTGGRNIESYAISWSGDGGNGGETVAGQAAGTSVCLPLPAFLPASTSGGATVNPYAVSVSAKNELGAGPPSAPKSFADAVPPFAPKLISASATPPGAAVQLSWEPPATDGGEPISEYVATVNPDGPAPSGCATPISVETLSLARSATVYLPCYGYRYDVTVAARSAAGTGPASAPSAALVAITVPGVPSGLRTSVSGRRVTLRWSGPSTDGGAPVSSYLVLYSGEGSTGEVTVRSSSDARVIGPGGEGREGTGQRGEGHEGGDGGRFAQTVKLPSAGRYEVGVLAVNAAGQGPAAKASVEAKGSSEGGECPPKLCSPPPPRAYRSPRRQRR